MLVGLLGLCCSLGCSEAADEFVPLDNSATLDGESLRFLTNLYWVESQQSGVPDQLRVEFSSGRNGRKDLLILLPVVGPGSLEGAYLYSQTGDTRTYDIRYVRGLDEQGEFEWSTNGEEGSQLVIVNEGKVEGVKVYTLRLEQFDLNYGQWDFLNGNWNSFGIKGFNFQYQGPIE